MLKRIFLTLPFVLALALAVPAYSATISYSTVLGGGNEVPPTGSSATGIAAFTLTGNLLTINESFSGLTAPASAAHIHCCAPAGVNATVAVPFLSFPNSTSGTFSTTVDLSLAPTYNAAFLTAQGGTASAAEAALIAGLNSGSTYANIHDSMFPGGEIRGQIAVTPEPASILLLGTGVIGIAQGIRRRMTK